MTVNVLKSLGLSMLFLMLSFSSWASPFEGYLEFKWTKSSISTTYKYYVKGENVRVEEINQDGEVEGIMLV